MIHLSPAGRPKDDNYDNDDEEYLFILMQQMQRTAMKAPKKTRQAIVRTATFCMIVIKIIIKVE